MRKRNASIFGDNVNEDHFLKLLIDACGSINAIGEISISVKGTVGKWHELLTRTVIIHGVSPRSFKK